MIQQPQYKHKLNLNPNISTIFQTLSKDNQQDTDNLI
jgi:hypothetical protein